MKEYLKKFATVLAHTTWMESDNYVTPSVAYITENGGSINYHKYVSGEELHNYANDYFTIVASDDGTIKINPNIYISTDDGNSWAQSTGDDIIVTNGDKILCKHVYNGSEGISLTIEINTNSGSGSGSGSGSSWEGGNILSTNINFNVEGNIMSLIYGDDFIGQTSLSGKSHIFSELFYNESHLINASNLILPATTLAQGCYQNMFYGCTSLTTTPELPATTLADYCYYKMFQDCIALTTAPDELLAMTLAPDCYSYMFSGCTALTTAPTLLATTLAEYCYAFMFNGCTSLTTVSKILPATTLVNNCYYGMFQNCTSLTTAPALPATTLVNNCYYGMFQNCTSLTTAPELPATTLATYCYGYMFYGCTSLTTAPELPANTLTEGCYCWMFKRCTSLTTAPALPATTLAFSCYSNMFEGCTNLNYIKCLATDISASNCTTTWLFNVASSGTFVKAASADWSSKIGSSGIPSGWTVQDA